ncbi:alpha/beta hydrolase [Paenibacillus chartarius]|uniref:Alpha/beta hydrolase n=1 Tax=Paenibacillus chartarius TaxID=747481 RepID=A0ABV6DGT7_9BACL
MTERIYRSPQPFHWEGRGERGETAIMLIHGFTGSPSEFRRFGYVLNDFGYTVNGVCLPGHGTKPEDMLGLQWPDWYGHVLAEYHKIKDRAYRRIVAVGHSMGGLLALKLGAEQPLDGVVSLASPIYLRDRKIWLAYPLQYVKKYVHKKPSQLTTRFEEIIAYDRSPLTCVVSLRGLMRHVAKLLPQVTAPLLVGQGEKDRTVLPASASFVYERAGSSSKRLIWYPHSSHAILMDVERDAVYNDVLAFVQEVDCSLSKPNNDRSRMPALERR